jgi:hypothetical protein
MATRYPAIDDKHRRFIERQRVFFTASAAAGTHINCSPRGTDCFRILTANRVVYLDRTGSGNETAAHLKADGRLTIMFCAFEGPPNILRLYGRGRAVHRGTDEYRWLLAEHYDGNEPLGTRQFIVLDVDLVQTSCGYGVPFLEYRGERPSMDNWSEKKGAEGLAAYQREKNVTSMDGLPTGLFEAEPTSAG